MEIAYEELIKEIFEYEHGERTKLSNTQLVAADEIRSVNAYPLLVYRINQLAEANYKDDHYKVHNICYDVFTYIENDIDPENMYQLIICNNYYQIYKFDQRNYDRRVLVCEFSMPGKIYSFNGGTILIVIGKGCSGIKYKNIEI